MRWCKIACKDDRRKVASIPTSSYVDLYTSTYVTAFNSDSIRHIKHVHTVSSIKCSNIQSHASPFYNTA